MKSDYAELKRDVESAGYFTAFQPIKYEGDRIILASHQHSAGLGGNSFWVAVRRGSWYVATWLPVIYRLRDSSRLRDLVVKLLSREPARAHGQIEEAIASEFDLEEIADCDFSDDE